MRSRQGVALGVLLAATFALPADLTSAAFPGRNGPIAYYGPPLSPGKGHAFLTDAEGAQPTEVPNSGQGPSLSPNGRTIAFDGGPHVIVQRLDGTHRRTLARGIDPSFSPNGKHIVYSSDGDIFVMSSRGRHVRQLTDQHGFEIAAEFSPNGKLIAFTREEDIYVMHADGSQVIQLTHRGKSDAFSSFSPSGKKLVYARGTEIWEMRIDGTDKHPVGVRGTTPSVSPNGNWIAFERRHRIHVVRRDGSGLRRITPKHVDALDPYWGAG
jgi:TolB protein